MDIIKDFMSTFLSTIIALIRLFFLTLCFVTSGLQVILFTRTEICNVEMRGQPFRCDRDRMNDKLSYVDKLLLENPGLLDLPKGELTEEEMRALEDFDNELDKEDDDNEGL